MARRAPPFRRGVFPVHGEDPALKALQSSLSGLERTPDALIAGIDDVYDPSGAGPARIAPHEARLPSSSAGRRDWHNEYAELLLDINEAVEAAADKRAKGVIIRRIREALKSGSEA